MKTTKKISLLLISFFVEISFIYAQTCPENIGFERATFSNWKTFSGITLSLESANQINVTEQIPEANRITINSSKTAKDPYGGFPVLAPNGSGYSVKLGDNGTGSQADRISYQITVPSDKSTFNITYQYALVFQDPNHPAYEQPRFTAKVLDLSTNTYISCASFNYISTSSLPGFKVSETDLSVIYKNWSAVNINLSGYQGKQVLLEFTAADCTQSGHFGYAYIDVNENCDNIIQGNDFCAGSGETSLKGPSGYFSYKWYNKDKSILYGEGESIVIKPALPIGDQLILDMVPFNGYGCPYSVSTTIERKYFDLNLVHTINACKGNVVNLISTEYILNKTEDLFYTVFTDEALQKQVLEPNKITKSGKYYVKASAAFGCSSVKAVDVIFHEINVDVIAEIKSCADDHVDLTSTMVQKIVPEGLGISYYSDLATTIPLTNPNKINTSGDYYIKYQSQYGAIVKKVSVLIYDPIKLKITNPVPVCYPQQVDITNASYTAGSDKGITLSYFKDIELKQILPSPKAIATSGTYYIKAINIKGCSVVMPIVVNVHPLPVIQVKDPAVVCYPATVDLTDENLYTGITDDVKFTFFNKEDGRKVTNPKTVAKTGTYIVNVKNSNGCVITKEIKVLINAAPKLVINHPKGVFIGQSVNLTHAKIIEGSKDYIKSGYWKDEHMKTPLLEPTKVDKTGTYYVSLTSSCNCVTVDKVNVTTALLPKIIVPTAFTPLKEINNKLHPFFEGIKKLVSFKIINKWGNVMFTTNSMDPKDGWNGYYKGVLQAFETYSWFAEGINELNQTYTTTGKTILIP